MLVPNLVFDVLLFGALLIAAFADGTFSRLEGAASLIAVGLAIYIAAQEWSDVLAKRRIWTQESLATAIALSTLGFIYFWWRSESDLALLALSIALMMSSLMVAIATIAALGAMMKDTSPAPLGGWLATIMGAFVLGVTGGVLVLFLGGGATLFAKLIVIGIGLFGWKIREAIRPPQENIHAADSAKTPTKANPNFEVPATHAQNMFVFPKRGTLLDRFVPVLLIGTILFIAARQIKSPDLWTPTPPASADNNGNGDNGSTP